MFCCRFGISFQQPNVVQKCGIFFLWILFRFRFLISKKKSSYYYAVDKLLKLLRKNLVRNVVPNLITLTNNWTFEYVIDKLCFCVIVAHMSLDNCFLIVCTWNLLVQIWESVLKFLKIQNLLLHNFKLFFFVI